MVSLATALQYLVMRMVNSTCPVRGQTGHRGRRDLRDSFTPSKESGSSVRVHLLRESSAAHDQTRVMFQFMISEGGLPTHVPRLRIFARGNGVAEPGSPAATVPGSRAGHVFRRVVPCQTSSSAAALVQAVSSIFENNLLAGDIHESMRSRW